MTEIKIEHRGYTIRFNENADEWTCSEADYYSSPSLSKVKAKIDKMLLDVRKASSVTVFEISHGFGRMSRYESKLTEFVKTKHDKDWRGNALPPSHIVASVAARDGTKKPARREMKLSDMMPDTPEAHAAYAACETLFREAKAAEKRAIAAFDAIPRVTLDDIRALVRLAEGTTND